MEANSWLHLADEDQCHRLPDDLRARDPFLARDCGWVEQMRPLIRSLSAPGDRVLDPFCGFGTSLVAASLEGRVALGIEVLPERAQIARERLARLGFPAEGVLTGGACQRLAELHDVDLIVTSLPYFGCAFDAGSDHSAQVYGARTYAEYLEQMRQLFAAFKPVLRSGAHVVAAIQNVELGPHLVPQAWDIARLLAERFTLREERMLVYDRPLRIDRAASRANRAHEYVLVAVNEAQPVDLDDSLLCVTELAREHGTCVVVGSFARWLRAPDPAHLPSDVDLLVPADLGALGRRCAWLEQQGFRIERWGAPVSSPALGAAAAGSHYIRARRLRADGRLCQIDLCFAEGDQAFAAALAGSESLAGLRVALGTAE